MTRTLRRKWQKKDRNDEEEENALRNKCPYSEFFWFVFSQIYSVNLHIQSKCGKIQTRKTPKTDNFNANCVSIFRWYCFDMCIVVVSVLGIILEELNMNEIKINTAALKAMRMLRVVRGINKPEIDSESCQTSR